MRTGRHLPAVVLAALTAAAGIWGAAPAVAAGVTLQYTCTLSGFPSQAMTAQIAWQAPAAVTVGQTMPTVTVNATATVGAIVTFGLGLAGVATVEGSVDAPGVIVAPEGRIPKAVQLIVPRIHVPPSGPMSVPASGTTPGVVFHQPGHATIVVDNNLTLHLTGRDAGGNTLPSGSVDLSCTLDSGQNAVVFSLNIAPAPAPPPPPRPTAAPLPRPTTTVAPGPVTTAPTQSSTAAVATTAQPTVSDPGSPTTTPTTISSLPTGIAVVRTAGPAGMDWWLAIVGVLVVVAAAIGTGWWLTRRVSGRGNVPR